MSWLDQAACKGKPTSLFFIEKGDSYDVARTLCSTCPVREECLEDALSWETQGQRNGFVGGLSPEERDHEVRYRRYAARRATA